jgi:hypothetical protein
MRIIKGRKKEEKRPGRPSCPPLPRTHDLGEEKPPLSHSLPALAWITGELRLPSFIASVVVSSPFPPRRPCPARRPPPHWPLSSSLNSMAIHHKPNHTMYCAWIGKIKRLNLFFSLESLHFVFLFLVFHVEHLITLWPPSSLLSVTLA